MSAIDDLKSQLKELSQKRSLLESEINAAVSRLDAAGVGMHAPLVDKEGFPLDTIDLPSIRADRHKVIILTNDHKDLTNQMELLLHRLHAATRDSHQQSLSSTIPTDIDANGSLASTRPIADPLAVPSTSTRPFAVVDELTQGSPADQAGLRLYDKMIRFGHVTGQTPNTFQAIAQLLNESEGRDIETVVLRSSESEVRLVLQPQKWEGRGLLGCHLQPI